MQSFTVSQLVLLLCICLCSCDEVVQPGSCSGVSCASSNENDAASMLQLNNMRAFETETDVEEISSTECKDKLKGCAKADDNWNMCDVSKRNNDKWWLDGCKKTCGSCPGGRGPPCKDKKPTSTCEKANKVWNMCNKNRWWKNQCKKTCGLCSGGGPAPTSAPAPAPATTPRPTDAPDTTPEPTDAPDTTPEPTDAPDTTPEPTDAPAPAPSPSDDWETGHATFYGDGGSGGHCGGSELWPSGYGSGSGWIDGLYVATASHMWCKQGTSCGNKHSTDCGKCYEVKCTGTDTNTDGYVPCTGKTVTVAVTDECPGGSDNPTHCTGAVNHFDLSTKAFKVIGDTKAGVIDIKWRQVACPVPSGENLKLVVIGNQWWFKMAPKDAAGPGHVEKIEMKSSTISDWKELDGDYGAFFKSTTNVGSGPYHFKLTAEDGQELVYEMKDLKAGTFDIGANFAAS